MIYKTTFKGLIMCGLLALTCTACKKDDNNTSNNNNNSNDPQDTVKRPDWGPTIAVDMLAVINKQLALGAKPIETLTPAEARIQPTVADAVKALAAEKGITPPPLKSDTIGMEIPVTGGTVHARIYKPRTPAPNPVILYYHGGGWVIADINVYDASARAMCEMTNSIVVAINYRKGPEFKFPTAHNDAFDAYKWAMANAASMGGDSTKMAVVGESAGGNLACNVSIAARNAGIRMPLYQVLVYPVASNNMNTDSYTKYANAKPLNKAMINWFLMYYLNSMSESADPRINLVAADLHGLPPTSIINAEIDPLRDDGAQLQTALKNAGVKVSRSIYTGATHEFFGAALVVAEAKVAEAEAAAALNVTLH